MQRGCAVTTHPLLKDREVTQTVEHAVLKQRMMRSLYIIINNDILL